MAEVPDMEWSVIKLRAYLITISVFAISILTFFLTSTSSNAYVKTANAIALSMIPACLIGILWEAFIKREFIRYVKKEIHLSHQFDRSGITNIFANRSQINLTERIKSARRRVWILVTSFSYLTETPGLHDELVRKADGGVELRVLGLDPKSETARLRRAFNPIYSTLKDEIPFFDDKFMSGFRNTKKASNFQIRFYNGMPTCACFIIDDQLFICPLLCHKRGRNSTHIQISKSTDDGQPTVLFKEYEDHFKELFDHPKTILPNPIHHDRAPVVEEPTGQP